MTFLYYSSYIIVLPAILVAIWASLNVKLTYSKYSKINNARGLTAAEVARQILDENGLNNVPINKIRGNLTDNYNPQTNQVNLSESVYNSTSVAAIGVAAHEIGHAIQHKEGYVPIRIRSAIVPATNIGSNLAFPLVFLGILFSAWGSTSFGQTMVTVGIWMFVLVVFFQLITLPVEFNASARAMRTLNNDGILFGNELKGARKTLTAAALTYVAALLTAILNLVRLIAISQRRR